MKLESTPVILDFDAFSTRTQAEATHNLGEEVRLADGRVFRYAKAGAAAISKGKLQLAPAPKTNHHNLTVTAAAAAGAFQVAVTLGATAATANEYAEGYLCVNDVDGQGQTYKIASHPAADASAGLTVTLFDPIETALTTSSQVSLIHNAYNGVVEGTSSTQKPAGVPLIDIAIGDYGWVQVKGVASVLMDETVTLGAWVTTGTSVAGAVEEMDDVTAPITDSLVGFAITAGVDTEYNPIHLDIS